MKRRLLFLLRGAIGLGLLAYLVLALSNPREIVAKLAHAHLPFLLIAFSLHASGLLILTMRWRMILAARGAAFSIGRLMQYNLVAKFFNLFLPGGFGGDLVRIADTRGIRDGISGSFAVVLYERMTGIFALTVFALIASLLKMGFISRLPALVPLTLGISAAVLLLFGLLPTALPRNLLQRLPARSRWLQRLLGFLDRVHTVLADFLKDGPLLAKTLGSAFLLQLNVVIYYCFIGKALQLDRIPFLDYFFIIPIMVFFLSIPISVGGIGIRDFILIQFFKLYYPRDARRQVLKLSFIPWFFTIYVASDIAATAAIAFATVDVLFNLILGAIGGVIYIIRKK